jgi:hypothetical protein
MEESASTRVVDVTQQAARWRRLRLRRRVLLLVAPLVCWYAAVVSYTVVGRHLPNAAALVLMVGVAACALGLLVVAARSRHDRSIVVGWRAIELAVRRRRGMALLLILVPVCVWMFLFVGLLVGAELALVMGGLFLPLWLVVAPLWPWLSRLWKRAATSPAADVLRADGRAPVVDLRSFAVDPTRASAGGSVEDAVVERMWLHGPVVAAARPVRGGRLGEPREEVMDGQRVLVWRRGRVVLWRTAPLAPLGAARAWLTSADWQRMVLWWLEQAQLVVVVLGSTDGLAWELHNLARLGLQDRLVIVVPPSWSHLSGVLAAHWQGLHQVLTVPGGPALPPSIDTTSTLAVVPGAGEPPTMIVSRSRRREDYEAAVELAAATIHTRREPREEPGAQAVVSPESPATSA